MTDRTPTRTMGEPSPDEPTGFGLEGLGSLFGSCLRMLNEEGADDSNEATIERVGIFGTDAVLIDDERGLRILVDQDLTPLAALAAVLRVIEEEMIGRDLKLRWGTFSRQGLGFRLPVSEVA